MMVEGKKAAELKPEPSGAAVSAAARPWAVSAEGKRTTSRDGQWTEDSRDGCPTT